MEYNNIVNQLIQKEIIDSLKENKYKNIDKVIGGLFNAKPSNKTILLKIEEEFGNMDHININSLKKQAVKKILKSEWYNYWLKNKVENDDKKIFVKYFQTFTVQQQQKILKHNDKSILENIEEKKENELTKAIINFKYNNIKELENWFNKQGEKIKLNEKKRIVNLLEMDDLPKNGLKLIVKIMDKYKIDEDFRTYRLLENENTEDFKELIDTMFNIKIENNKISSWSKSKKDLMSQVIAQTTNMDIYFGMKDYVTKVFETILIAKNANNIEVILNLPEIKKDTEKFKNYTEDPQAQGLNLLLNIIEKPNKSGQKILNGLIDDYQDDSSENEMDSDVIKNIKTKILHAILNRNIDVDTIKNKQNKFKI